MKKGLTIFTVSALGLLLVGCGSDKKNVEESNSNSNNESNITSNITSNIESNSNSNIESNITSNIESNSNSNINPLQGKKLSCSMDYTANSGMPEGTKMLMGADINFTSNDKIADMTIAVTFELSGTYKSQIDTLVNTMNETYKSQYKGEHFKVSTTKLSDSKFVVKIYMDYQHMTEDEKKAANVSGSGLNESYEFNKKQLEQQGFSCK